MVDRISAAVPIAMVQHANQFLITNGYTNRPGITEILGSPGGKGLRAVLQLHAACRIPLHLHVSGTLIEAIAWHDPKFLEEARAMVAAGLLEIVGSTYAQNIMPLFSAAHNRWQIVEALRLYERWLGVDPESVKVFWPPERVWNTEQLAPVLADPTLPNGGYEFVLLDDRILLPQAQRCMFDADATIVPELFQARPIAGGQGLIALPLARSARLAIPFETPAHRDQLASLMAAAADFPSGSIIIYGDDMEKCSAIAPWNTSGVLWYEAFLRYLTQQRSIKSVLLSQWLKTQERFGEAWPVDPGCYKELARDFRAGEDYLGWAEGAQWRPYAQVLQRVDEVIRDAESRSPGSDALLELAKKQYAACTFETAWHDAPGSIHGSAASARPTPWAKALAKHAAAAMVMVSARHWARERAVGSKVSVQVADIDEDGSDEVILRNEHLAAVFTPRFGGRLVYLFGFSRGEGALVVGNPADDWNWMEELNDYPEQPPNHPGALSDVGFEHDRYAVHIDRPVGRTSEAIVYMVNEQPESRARGLVKRIALTPASNRLDVRYIHIPSTIRPLRVGLGLSPDYLNLLRCGVDCVQPVGRGTEKGFQCGQIGVTVRLEDSKSTWAIPQQPSFGHGFRLEVRSGSSSLALSLACLSLSDGDRTSLQPPHIV